MEKITALAFYGKDKKGGLLEQLIYKAVTEKKAIVKGLGSGLELVVAKNTGTATFYCRNPKTKIGSVTKITLAQAFEKVRVLKNTLRIENRKKAEEEEYKRMYPLFKDFFVLWLEEKKKNFKESSNRAQNFMSLFRHTLFPLYDFRLDELTPKLVYEEISKVKQSDYNKYASIEMLNQCLNNACIKGIIDTNPVIPLLGNSESPFKKPKAVHHKSVEAELLKECFFIPLKDVPLMNKVFYLYLVLTAFRFGECRFLRWSWCDFEKKEIVIKDGEFGANKTGNTYIKPMTTQVVRLLKYWKLHTPFPESDFVFRSSDIRREAPISEHTFRQPFNVLKKGDFSLHGFRTTMKSWLMSDSADNMFLAELCLTHDVRSEIQKTYDDKSYMKGISKCLQKWNDYVESQLPNEYLELIKDN